MTDALTDLISRLEQAEEGSRELDARIAVEVKFIHSQRGLPIQIADLAAEFDMETTVAVVGDSISAWSKIIPHYTTSIDAAFTLAPAEGWLSIAHRRNPEDMRARTCHAGIEYDGAPYYSGAFAPTFPLAMCVAALEGRRLVRDAKPNELQARQSMEGEGR